MILGKIDSFREYQEEAGRTRNNDAEAKMRLSELALGLAGEAAGEVVDGLKKHIHHGHPMNKEKLSEELGDVLWYIAAIATEIGVPLDVIATHNIEKLRRRYPDGFSEERSKNRVN